MPRALVCARAPAIGRVENRDEVRLSYLGIVAGGARVLSRGASHFLPTGRHEIMTSIRTSSCRGEKWPCDTSYRAFWPCIASRFIPPRRAASPPRRPMRWLAQTPVLWGLRFLEGTCGSSRLTSVGQENRRLPGEHARAQALPEERSQTLRSDRLRQPAQSLNHPILGNGHDVAFPTILRGNLAPGVLHLVWVGAQVGEECASRPVP
jgi:hypothetical protein